MPRFNPAENTKHSSLDGLPPNPFNSHCWITGSPEIGLNTWIGAFTLIDGQGGLHIGNSCNISSGAAILTHSTAKRCVTEGAHPIEHQPTRVEDHVFIGENATVLMGSVIGHHSIVGAGAMVAEGMTIPPYSLVLGVPARVVRSIETEVRQNKWKNKHEHASQPHQHTGS